MNDGKWYCVRLSSLQCAELLDILAILFCSPFYLLKIFFLADSIFEKGCRMDGLKCCDNSISNKKNKIEFLSKLEIDYTAQLNANKVKRSMWFAMDIRNGSFSRCRIRRRKRNPFTY